MARNILFLSPANGNRSQMAEGMARHFLGHQADILSAGLKAAEKISHMAVAVMGEIGIDISKAKPKSVDVLGIRRFDVIILIHAEDEEVAIPAGFEGKKILHWQMADPGKAILINPEDQIRKFRKVRDEIRKRVLDLRAADQVW